MAVLNLTLLGTPYLAGPDQAPLELRSPYALALLAYLAVESAYEHSYVALLALLWPDRPEAAARARLRATLAALRQELGEQAWQSLQIGRSGLRFRREGALRLDVAAFSELMASCRAHRHERIETCPRCIGWLGEAMERYRGEFLAGFALHESPPFQAWAGGVRERLRQQALEALGALAAAAERQGDQSLAREYGRRRSELGPEGGLARRVGAAEEPVQRGALPTPPTSFIGRERERAEIKGALEQGRLVTLSGAGGSGKTRLATEVAGELSARYDDGVQLIELALLADPALVARTVASAFGLREAAGKQAGVQLVEELHGKHLLLVLDNCEHLIEACGRLVDELLRGCPRLSILATSREALGLSGERLWVVPPLSLPGERAELAPKQLLGFESVRLFVERAQASSPAFQLTTRNAHMVAQICRRLDGIPLALELAAAAIPRLGVESIASRLEHGLAPLSVTRPSALPHQRSLRATIDWSYERLSQAERAAFCRLAVFVGGWTPEAAQAVLGAEGPSGPIAPETLESLAEKSLIYRITGRAGDRRYRMLSVLREYATARLTASGDAPHARRAHASFYLGLAEQAEPELQGLEQRAWLDRLEEERNDLEAALRYCLEPAAAADKAEAGNGERVEMGLRLAAALGEFWWPRGYLSEGRRWLARMLAQGPAPTPARAKALYRAGELSYGQSDYPEALALLGESLELYRRQGDARGVACVLRGLSNVYGMRGDEQAAAPLRAESLALFRELGDAWGCAWMLLEIGRGEADPLRQQALLEQSLSMARSGGYPRTIATALGNLGKLDRREGRREAAERRMQEALAIGRALGDTWISAWMLDELGLLASDRGDVHYASALFAESLALFKQDKNEGGVIMVSAHIDTVRRQYRLSL